MKDITSRDNQWIKAACALKQKKGRWEAHRFFAEGFRIICDAIHVGVTDGVCFVSPKGQSHPGFSQLEAAGEKLGWEFFDVT